MTRSSSAALVSARIDRLPATAQLWSWVARISFGAFFEIYEVALTAVLGPALAAAGVFRKGHFGLFGLPDQASFAFVTFAGLLAGALIFGSIADRLGRRPLFTLSLVWYAAASAVMGLQDSVATICLWRFIGAIGVGAQVVAIDSYLAELTPKALRGRSFALSKFLQYLAVPVVGALSVLLVPHGAYGIAGWRWLAFIPVVGAVAIWLVRLGLPESPRWLAEHGRAEEAEQLLTRLEQRAEKKTGRPLPELEVPAPPPEGRSTFAELWSRQLRGRVLVLVIASATGTIAYFGFGNWLPSLIEAQGVTITKSLLYAAATTLAQPLAPLVFILFADRIERKWQIIVGGCLSAIFGLLFLRQSTAAGWIAFGVLITAANNLWSYGIHTYRSELFPTRVRARAIGFVYSADRLIAAFSGYLIGFVLVSFGVPGVFVLMSAMLAISALSIAVFGPRSTGLAAEEIAPDRTRALVELSPTTTAAGRGSGS